ncbi:MAG TPA: Flp pilus assembly protein CpaB [Propioniciclava sp.]|uniref:Flp pilus assembly protein CpaB n=1 Tax=Propioniciclava sp. TaxID=2038686 RepID=UPI002C72A6CB|nr:Flp pilus assembly protein CpaB [Propioniciclava sp.]HRL47778.1 Flp pilus assembly protein CpaB [Propioniciclava sp.]HRL80201.1 Flp pilus assembly protein CpaB [Propioniciclava sp.]
MNPRQRRGLLFMAVALLVALGTFVAVSTFVANVNSQVGQRVTVYQARQPIDPYTPLSADVLEPVEVPRRWVSESSIVGLSELTGRRISFRVNAGTTISSDMLIPNSSLSSTERELAINVDPVTGVAGRVRPGDRVDVYAVFGDVPGLPKQVRILQRNVRIVSIAGQQTVTQQNSDGTRESEVIPVTLAVEPEAALSITYASAFAQEVRLVALPSDVGVNRTNESDTFDASKLGGQAIPEGNR